MKSTVLNIRHIGLKCWLLGQHSNLCINDVYIQHYICKTWWPHLSIWPLCHRHILIILLERAKPGLLAAPKLFLSPICYPWPTPSTHSIGFLCRILNGCPRPDFSLAFFSHNYNVTNWQECSYITLGTLFSFFRYIIKPSGLLIYQDLIHFV